MIRYLFSKFKFYIKKIFLIQKKSLTVIIPKESILKYLPQNPVIIDCGAHIGLDTIELSKIPGSKIYAFEPIPYLFSQLCNNTSKIENIKCFNLALNNFDGFVEMHVSSGASDGSSSILQPKNHLKDHPDVHFNEKIIVKCQTLDSWALGNGTNKVDMLWLDMQGAEYQMLSASKTIFRNVHVIHTEVSMRETYSNVSLYKYFKKFLYNEGYKVKIESIPQGYDMGNVLFVRVKD